MMDRLARLPGVTVYRGEDQSGLFSGVVDGMDCEDAAEALARRGIAVRAGLHCAPLAHHSAGTADTGTVRFSFSAFNRADQADRAAEAIRTIIAEGPDAAMNQFNTVKKPAKDPKKPKDLKKQGEPELEARKPEESAPSGEPAAGARCRDMGD